MSIRRIACFVLLIEFQLVGQRFASSSFDADAAVISGNSNAGSSVEGGVAWGSLLPEALSFLSLEEGVRLATQKGVRHSHESFFGGWAASLGNLHGWADGDPFINNYVGHPIQGAVSGFLWVQNDLRFRHAEFGRNRHYWKSRLRAAAFALAYSEEEELGPLSEASLGATQAKFPQQGFADHVITPAMGLGWMVTEDALDKYVIQKIDNSRARPIIKALVRAGLNPSRSMANVLAGRVPWNRLDRGGLFGASGSAFGASSTQPSESTQSSETQGPYRSIAPFEFSFLTTVRKDPAGNGPCIGGGAQALVRVFSQLAIVAEVADCKLLGLPRNLSGDALDYVVGPRWSPWPTARWSPYVQVLAGGQKTSFETFFPAAKAALEQSLQAQGLTLQPPDHALYTSDTQSNAAILKLGVGVDWKLTSAIAIRPISIDYGASQRYPGQLAVNSGLVLRFGTW